MFDAAKSEIVSKADLSRKGQVDEDITELVLKINCHNDLVTLSSCSGRIVVFAEEIKGAKRGCQWIEVNHRKVAQTDDEIWNKIAKVKNVNVRFEPFVLHTRCRSLDSAAKLLSVSVESGFKNSGISVGGKKRDKFVVATRSAHTMEVPLSDSEGQLLVTREYLQFVLNLANEKMEENCRRIRKFEENLSKAFFD